MGRKQKGQKTKDFVKVTKKDKVKRNLPPCRVCNAPAAGYHYGVNTCEACKGFFHRSLRLNDQYICEKNETCEIMYGKKKMCQKCRYDKCVHVGMAKDAIKTGRYTTSKHTKDTLEIQRLKGRERLQSKIIGEGLLWNAVVNSAVPEEKDKDIVYGKDGSPTSGEKQDLNAAECCNEDGVSARCLRNLPNCPSYIYLREKLGEGADQSFMVHCITTASIQTEPLCNEGWNRTSLCKSLRKRIMRRYYKSKGNTSQHGSSHSSCASSPSSAAVTSPKSVDSKSSCSPLAANGCISSSLITRSFCCPMSTSSTGGCESSSHTTHSSMSTFKGFHPHGTSPEASKHGCGTCDNCEAESCGNNPTWTQCTSCGLHFDTRSQEELYSDKDQVIKVIMEAHDIFIEPNLMRIPKDEMERIAAEHVEICQLGSEMFGSRNRLPDSEYDYIYASTGIDADNRRERFDVYIQAMEKMVRSIVKFSKAIPGFSQLPTSVKVNLIKVAVMDVVILNCYMNVSTPHGVSCGYDRIFRCYNEVCQDIYDGEHTAKIFSYHLKLAQSLQNLELTREEEVLLKAIAIMSPDRELWSPGEPAKNLYEQLHECLIHLLKQKPGNHMMRYAHILDRLVELRTYGHNITSLVKRMGIEKYTRLLLDPMLRGMMVGILFDDEEEDEEMDEENVGGKT